MKLHQRLIILLDEGWVWLYTAGMPRSLGDERRTELQNDQWEFMHAERTLITPNLLSRFLLGVPDDVLWRASLGRGGFSRESIGELALAALVGICLLVLQPVALFLAVNPELARHEGSFYFVLAASAAAFAGLSLRAMSYNASCVALASSALALALALWWTVTAPILAVATCAWIALRSSRRQTRGS